MPQGQRDLTSRLSQNVQKGCVSSPSSNREELENLGLCGHPKSSLGGRVPRGSELWLVSEGGSLSLCCLAGCGRVHGALRVQAQPAALTAALLAPGQQGQQERRGAAGILRADSEGEGELPVLL